MAEDVVTSAPPVDTQQAAFEAPQISASDPAVQAQVNAVVAQMTAHFETQRKLVMEQAQQAFQRQLAEMQARQDVEAYAQHITTPTMQRPHALPGQPATYAEFLLSLSAPQRQTARGLFDGILAGGLVNFEEIGSQGEGEESKDAKAEFESAVTAKMAGGLSRSAAILAVKDAQPALFAAYNATGGQKKGGR